MQTSKKSHHNFKIKTYTQKQLLINESTKRIKNKQNVDLGVLSKFTDQNNSSNTPNRMSVTYPTIFEAVMNCFR